MYVFSPFPRDIVQNEKKWLNVKGMYPDFWEITEISMKSHPVVLHKIPRKNSHETSKYFSE